MSDDPDATLRDGIEAALRAVQLDGRNPYAQYAVAVTHMCAGLPEPAIRAARKALALNPTFALGHLVLGASHLYAGRPQDAIEPLEHGLRLSPFDPQNFAWSFFLALAYYFAGDLAKGLEDARRALALRPHWSPALTAVALCSLALGYEAQARAAVLEQRTCNRSGGDLVGLITRYNPAWAEHINEAMQRASQEPL